MSTEADSLKEVGEPALYESESRVGRWFLMLGPVATLLYMGLDAFAATRYRGYSYASQSISELSAVAAPTRRLWLPVAMLYSILMVVFSFGIWLSAEGKGAIRAVALAAGAVGMVGLCAWPFAPMHKREVLAAGGGTMTDRLHIALGAVDSILFFTAAGFGANALGKRFRFYSWATILLLLGFGTSMSADGPKIARNEPTPWIGIKERVAVFGAMIWMAVFGIGLLLSGSPSPRKR